MSIVCPKCSYVRQPGDSAPDYQCPNCDIVYSKFRAPVVAVVLPATAVRSPFYLKCIELRNAASNGAKKFLKYAIWFIAFCVAVATYGAIDHYFEARAAKKMQTEENLRRERMGADARQAEDTAKAKAAADKLIQEKRSGLYIAGKIACAAAWKSQLKDPYSAILEGFEGGVDKKDNDQFYAEIRGRAKNSFGAFVPGTWYCAAKNEGGSIKITYFGELK